MESRGLILESYKVAFTPGLLSQVYQRDGTDLLPNPANVLGGPGPERGGYVDLEGDGHWWVPSGKVFYSPATNDAPAQELTYANGHFFLPCRYQDPFHSDQFNTETTVRFDVYDLLVLETQDPLGNRVTAGSRDPENTTITTIGLDYRVLQPALVMDPNRNRAAVAFDALGMVVGTAVMGKPEENCGDSLEGFVPDLPDKVLSAHLNDPLKNPLEVLKHATTRLLYDLFAYYRTKDQTQPLASAVYTMVRETHESDLAPGQETKVQHSFSYSDGFGREIQKKIQAEPGPGPKRDPGTGKIILKDGQPELTDTDINPRWVGTGWTIFNNKGKPVRQFEPFFTDTHRFEYDVQIGVASTLFYDPPGRVVATLHPNHTWEKVVFDAWKQETWDVNDTVLIPDPTKDANVGAFFSRIPKGAYSPTWYAQRIGGDKGRQEMQAAQKAAVHAETSTVAHFDSLGRVFLTVAHNRAQFSNAAGPTPDEFYATRLLLDIEGNQRQVIDAKDRVVMRYDYDMLGSRIHSASMEAGQRWMLGDAAGKPLYAWDSRDHQFRYGYDQLRRPETTYLKEGTDREMIVGRMCYGESQPNPEATNLRTRGFAIFDQGGYESTSRYDYTGNLLLTERWLAKEYKKTLDWTNLLDLEPESFQTITTFDALNRPVQMITPDMSIVRPAYNEANLLEKVEATLAGDSKPTTFVANLDYNAKGQRIRIDYGNGVSTIYEYDQLTFRLIHLASTRKSMKAPDLQDLAYTYDPVGNITYINDNAQQTIFFKNKKVEPSADYVYDAIYRLIEATGREHLGQNGQPITPDPYDTGRVNLPQPADGNAMGTYLERYLYDAVGNFLEMQHHGTSPANPGWTRTYSYNEPSLTEGGKQSNRLSATSVGGINEPYAYDVHGNMTQMPHLTAMQWDYRDQLAWTARTAGAGTETTYYTYDSTGQRIRKVTETDEGSRKAERVYIGRFELYREYAGNGATVTLERETLHLMDDKQRTALVERRTKGTDGEAVLFRYQLGNHLGTSCIELDKQSQLISYEEYYPYGNTSYQASRSGLETNPKRYRFTSKERDEETALYYHGARYYAPWLGRWTASDPGGLIDGDNLYRYVMNNPIKLHDPTGNLTWGQAAGIGGAILVGTVLTVATAGLAGPLVGAAAATVIGGVVGGGVGAGVGEFVEARIDNRESHVLKSALLGAAAGGVFAGAGVAAGALARSNIGQAVTTAIADSALVQGIRGAASSLISQSARQAVGESAVARAGSAAARQAGRLLSAVHEASESAGTAIAKRIAGTPAQRAAEGFVRAGGTETLVGTSRSQMRREAERIIAGTPDHPLEFLLESGKFKPTRGLTHAELINEVDRVQMGHITSNKLGGPERLMLQDAYENQINNVTIESPRVGGAVLEQPAVSIGGIGVSKQTALMWEKFGQIPAGTTAHAPGISLTFSPIAPLPGASGAAIGDVAADKVPQIQSPAITVRW